MARPARLTLLLWGLWIVAVIGSPFARSPSPDPKVPLQPPSLAHPLGTTPVGGDLMWTVALAILRAHGLALLATALACAIALPLGLLAAHTSRSWVIAVEHSTATMVDAISPIVLLAVILVALPNIPAAGPTIVLGIFGWTFLVGAVRRNTSDLLRSRHVFSLRSIGYSQRQILFAHIAPELAWRLAPQATALATIYVGAFGAVEFLGLGVRRQSSLGYLVLDGLDHVNRAPHYFLSALIASLLAVFVLGWASAALGEVAKRHKGTV